MRCFYCGKRVSLVRKRIDTDFCSDEHREQYHARTRRTMEALVEDEGQRAVNRRLTDGFPIRLTNFQQGTDLDDLVIRTTGKLLQFTWMPTGLPLSQPILHTTVPAAGMFPFRAAGRTPTAPAPRLEPAWWSLGSMQNGPKPPRPFFVTILLPQGGLRAGRKPQVHDRPRRPLPAAVELGTRAPRLELRSRSARAAANSMGAFVSAVRPPDSIHPPPASRPIVVTLRHPVMAVRVNSLGAPKLSIRMPVSGQVELLSYAPRGTAQRPPAPAYARIAPRGPVFPATRIGAGTVRHLREPKGAQRMAPCPDGFRRKQYYSWELLERLCRLGFETVANYRPEIPIVATPQRVSAIGMAKMWAAAQNDAETAKPEPRRPAQPFPEKLELPGRVPMGTPANLACAQARQVAVERRDAGEWLQARLEQGFRDFVPVPSAGVNHWIQAAKWAWGTAEAREIADWLKPQTRGSKRTACDAAIPARTPVYAGPLFAGGNRQMGPAPEKPLTPPRLAPAAARPRSVRVETKAGVRLPEVPQRTIGLRQTALVGGGCQAPIGTTSSASRVQPAYPIPIGLALPPDHLRAGVAGGLRGQPPVRQNGAARGLGKGSPQRMEREALERFRRRWFARLRSSQLQPRWPAGSTPGLAAPPVNQARPHPYRAPGYAGAESMLRNLGQPRAEVFRRSCTLMDWDTLQLRACGLTDWGRKSRAAGVPLVVNVMLPIDPHGPIRDWGLAPPPEPEKPPEPIHEDFALGLANWICAGSDWRQDIAGVRTGSLALLRASLAMRDYEFEFLGKIENLSLGWVFRASNPANYHAAQIAADPGSPARLLRFSVLAGEREEAAAAALPMAITKNASCRVKMTVRGDEFTVFVNDKPVSQWSDDRLPDGGIGFFSEADDRARLYWVRVAPYGETPEPEPYPALNLPRSERHSEIRMGV